MRRMLSQSIAGPERNSSATQSQERFPRCRWPPYRLSEPSRWRCSGKRNAPLHSLFRPSNIAEATCRGRFASLRFWAAVSVARCRKARSPVFAKLSIVMAPSASTTVGPWPTSLAKRWQANRSSPRLIHLAFTHPKHCSHDQCSGKIPALPSAGLPDADQSVCVAAVGH